MTYESSLVKSLAACNGIINSRSFFNENSKSTIHIDFFVHGRILRVCCLFEKDSHETCLL